MSCIFISLQRRNPLFRISVSLKMVPLTSESSFSFPHYFLVLSLLAHLLINRYQPSLPPFPFLFASFLKWSNCHVAFLKCTPLNSDNKKLRVITIGPVPFLFFPHYLRMASEAQNCQEIARVRCMHRSKSIRRFMYMTLMRQRIISPCRWKRLE